MGRLLGRPPLAVGVDPAREGDHAVLDGHADLGGCTRGSHPSSASTSFWICSSVSVAVRAMVAVLIGTPPSLVSARTCSEQERRHTAARQFCWLVRAHAAPWARERVKRHPNGCDQTRAPGSRSGEATRAPPPPVELRASRAEVAPYLLASSPGRRAMREGRALGTDHAKDWYGSRKRTGGRHQNMAAPLEGKVSQTNGDDL